MINIPLTYKGRKRSKAYSRPGMRTCLMCGRGFRSNGPQNRRCPRCNYLLDHSREGTYYEPTIYGLDSSQRVAEESLDVV